MAVAAIQEYSLFFFLGLTFLIGVVDNVEVFGNKGRGGRGVVEAGTGQKQRLCAPSSLLCNSSSFSRPPKCDTLKGSGCVRAPCFCVARLHLGPVRSRLNEVTLAIAGDVCTPMCPSSWSVHLRRV